MKKAFMPLSELLAGAEIRRSDRIETRKPALTANTKHPSGRCSALLEVLNDDIANRQKHS